MMKNGTQAAFLRTARRVLRSEAGRAAAGAALWFAGGFALSAASVGGRFQPLALGLVCAGRGGLSAVAAALGGALGYLRFWGPGAWQGVFWLGLGLAVSLTLGDRGISHRQTLMLPACAAVVTAGGGVLFLFRYGDGTPIPAYLLRVGLSLAATLVFRAWLERRGSWADWLAQGLLVLALAQIAVLGVNLGHIAAGYLASQGALASAALAGLGLDLARPGRVGMTGVLCLSFCLRLVPGKPRWLDAAAPALAYGGVALLTGHFDPAPVPGLLLGGAVRALVPSLSRWEPKRRRGETAVAQLRLEQMALALRHMEQSLLLTAPILPDREAVLDRVQRAACDTCPERRGCKGRLENLEERLLEQPGLGEEDLPQGCRKPGRYLYELRRGQEQLRRMKGDRRRLEGYQCAARDQYAFLADFLQNLAAELGTKNTYRPPKYTPEVGLCTRSHREVNGDQCLWFPGTGNDYYVLLCDGMGTGAGAAQESQEAAKLLKRLLCAGFPAEYALRSLNSLAVLRELGGCTTVDLVHIQLDTGRSTLYKWGAAPSYLLKNGQLRKIGTAGPPPGLSQQARETVDRLSLGGGEVLILLSDGAGEDTLLRTRVSAPTPSPGELAAAIVEQGAQEGDDATVAVVQLRISDATA
ncbi:MAG: SpoIIE family protein phosphatase [Oscillospiraceae bacterium]|nr:SpoIIE family protein phosphatase [Oscillospiraceae bacterium]